jgi:sulfate adenylyltransferase subunit 1
MRPLRVVVAGSVDDGKSTLIGRLLLDCGALLADQLAALRVPAASEAQLDLARATDGLEAERAQSITIDVAHRSFATPRRKFLLADAPGHEQYTRNMVTAAAGADAAVVLVDPTKLDLAAEPVRLLPQTRRHALLARLVGVPSLVFAVNKLDAVGDPHAVFTRVRGAVDRFCAEAKLAAAAVVPISALRGDNVVQPQGGGPSLLALLEAMPAAGADAEGALRLPVQYVARHPDGARVLWGRIERGRLAVGDELVAMPHGAPLRVRQLWGYQQSVASAVAGQSVGVVVDAALDLGRGDWLVGAPVPAVSANLVATVVWLDEESPVVGRVYALRHGTRWTRARLQAIRTRLDLDTLRPRPANALAVNDIGTLDLEAEDALPIEPFTDCTATGAFVLVDSATLRTAAVGFVAV